MPTSELRLRPKVRVKPNDNITVTASWIEQDSNNMTKLMEEYGFVITNVSMAMPHSVVSSAAMDPINKILQTDDLDGLGIYRIKASVPSPVMHILCATLSKSDLRPVVQDLWNQSSGDIATFSMPNISDPHLGGTPLDDVYRWGQKYGDYRWPPLFPRLPNEYEMLLNDTLHLPSGYGRQTVYLLGSSPARLHSDEPAYPLCQMQVSTTPRCTTLFNASNAGAFLEADCEESDHSLHYIESRHNASEGNMTMSREWPNIAGDMFRGNLTRSFSSLDRTSRLTNATQVFLWQI